LEDKIGLDMPEPLLINQEGAFFYSQREEVETMDMESDMGDGDMGKMKNFGAINNIHPPLIWPFHEKSFHEKEAEINFWEKI
jgi:hypothetical protein